MFFRAIASYLESYKGVMFLHERPMSSVPLTQTSDLLAKLHSILPPALGSRMKPSLRALWVSQVRNLCQGIHETLGGRIFTEFPPTLQKELRTGVKILLSNMVRGSCPFFVARFRLNARESGFRF